jgi:hypothetical protein
MGCGASVAASSVDLNRTGEALVANLDLEERKFLLEWVEENNKFAQTNGSTRLFIEVCNLLVNPLDIPDTSLVGAEKIEAPGAVDMYHPKQVWPKAELGLCGLKFIQEDEDVKKASALTAFGTSIFWATAQEFPFDEDREDLVYFESREEAVVTMNASFGKILPPQFNRWPNAERDENMVLLCTAGLGQLYLRPVTGEGPEQSNPKRVVPPGTTLECNLDAMGKYGTRRNFVSYGATVFLGGKEGCSDPPKLHELELKGVFTCEQTEKGEGSTTLPADPGWEHAKAIWRSSLVTDVTLKHHLAHL